MHVLLLYNWTSYIYILMCSFFLHLRCSVSFSFSFLYSFTQPSQLNESVTEPQKKVWLILWNWNCNDLFLCDYFVYSLMSFCTVCYSHHHHHHHWLFFLSRNNSKCNLTKIANGGMNKHAILWLWSFILRLFSYHFPHKMERVFWAGKKTILLKLNCLCYILARVFWCVVIWGWASRWRRW